MVLNSSPNVEFIVMSRKGERMTTEYVTVIDIIFDVTVTSKRMAPFAD